MYWLFHISHFVDMAATIYYIYKFATSMIDPLKLTSTHSHLIDIYKFSSFTLWEWKERFTEHCTQYDGVYNMKINNQTKQLLSVKLHWEWVCSPRFFIISQRGAQTPLKV